MSTEFREIYSLSKLLPVVRVNPYDFTGDSDMLDVLNYRMVSLIRSVKSWRPYEYNGTEHITSISYKVYRTTTLYWLIEIYNGIMHSLEIPAGMILKIPDLASVDEYLRRVRKNDTNVSKVVVI